MTLGAIAAGILVWGCGRERPLGYDLQFEVVVESDPGVALAGVAVAIDGDGVGSTDSRGRLSATRFVVAGQLLTIAHVCPPRFVATSAPRAVRVRRFTQSSGSDRVKLRLRCRSESRLAVFIVRTRGAAEVEIAINGGAVTRTDGAGVAHVSFRARPGTEFLVELTSRIAMLRPRRVSRVFTLRDSDEIFVFDQPYRRRPKSRRAMHTKPRIVRIE